jgi:putative dimethyl sulfoxide reductase chaperone
MPTDGITLHEMADLTRARSRFYGFLGGVYNRLPDVQLVQSLFSQELAGFLAALGNAEGLARDMYEGVRLVGEYIHSVEKTPPDELRTELAVERTRLFRGIKPGYGPPPPYESVYAGIDNQPHMQSNMAVRQLYAEAGVGLPEDLHDQPDFIGFELDFMRHLADRESQALTDGDQDAALQVLAKEHAFLQDHILRWIPHFCDIAIEQARSDFYKGIAYLTKGFVIDDAEHVRALREPSSDPGPTPDPSVSVV